MNPSQPRFHQGLHRFALVTAGCTFLLLLAGALVTSTGSSLSVPDWPLSFGTLFPQMTGGVLFEHGHRMVAGTVACLTLALAFFTWKAETRKWVKVLAGLALLAVILQAVLGGVTVLYHLPTAVSVCHAGLAQIFFCLTVTLALVTSRGWILGPPPAGDFPASIRSWAVGTTAVTYVQILLGALTRHSGAGLAIPDFPLSFGHVLPPEWNPLILVHFCHRVGAFSVLGLVLALVYRVAGGQPEKTSVVYPALCAGFLVLLQMGLGMMILFTRKAIVPTSLHVITGAALLASLLVLTLQSFRVGGKAP